MNESPTPREITAQVEALVFHLGAEQHELLTFLSTFRFDRNYTVRELAKRYYPWRAEQKGESAPNLADEEYVEKLHSRLRSIADGLKGSLETYYTKWRGGEIRNRDGGINERLVYIGLPSRGHSYKPIYSWVERQPQSDTVSSSCDILETFSELPRSRVRSLLSGSGGSGCRTITIAVTCSVDLERWQPVLTKAITKGAFMQVLLSHPESTFLTAREKSIDRKLRKLVKENIAVLQELPNNSVEVKLAGGVIPFHYVRIDDTVLFAPFWIGGAVADGYHCLTNAHLPFGEFLDGQFRLLWDSLPLLNLAEKRIPPLG